MRPTLARDRSQGVSQLSLIDAAVATGIHSIEQSIQLPLQAAHTAAFMAVAVVALTVHMVMMMVMAMTCTGAAQECHRTVNELFLRNGTVLVSIERVEQDFGAARST